MREAAGRHRQQGAVIITVALLTLFLLGFMGFALDFGRLFVVKSELQTAMDSCALAAAQELDLQPTAIERATNAGLTAGNLNRVNLQSATWGGDQGQACSVSAVAPCLTTAQITFKDPSYLPTTNPALAQYAQCEHVQSGVQDVADAGHGRLLRQHHDIPQYPQRAGQCRRDARHRPEHLPDSGCASTQNHWRRSGPNTASRRRMDHAVDESEHRPERLHGLGQSGRLQ